MPTRHALAVGTAAPCAHVAPEIDEAVARARFLRDRRHAVGRVFLADAAEVDRHAGAAAGARACASHSTPAKPTCASAARDRVARPGAARGSRAKSHARAQHAGRDVEPPVALREARSRVAQQRGGLGIDRAPAPPPAPRLIAAITLSSR